MTHEKIEIRVGDNAVAVVDAQDAVMVSGYTWHLTTDKRYAIASISRDGKQCHLLMHRLILNAADDLHTDHIDGNGLNNSRSNLRPCTSSQNMCNRGKPKHGRTSVYKGVSRSGRKGKPWQAFIGLNGRDIALGAYADEVTARDVYDVACVLLHGDFARPNVARDKRSVAGLTLAQVKEVAKTEALANEQKRKAVA